jgi:hypothetical protein
MKFGESKIYVIDSPLPLKQITGSSKIDSMSMVHTGPDELTESTYILHATIKKRGCNISHSTQY